MNFRKKCQLLNLIVGLFLATLLVSCGGSSESVMIEVGKEFEVKGKKLKIEKIKATTILSNDEQKVSILAPEGKQYVYFELSNPDDVMVFIKAESDGEKIEVVDDMRLALDFSHEVGTGFQDAYFLVDEGQDIEFSITTPSSDTYKVAKTDLKIENDREILPEMKELLTKYSEPTNLLKPLELYVEGKPIRLAKEKGELVPTSPLTKDMIIDYVFPDGQKYLTSTGGLISTKDEITWKDGKIVGFEFGW